MKEKRRGLACLSQGESKYRLARAEGHEPATLGFGDRYSTISVRPSGIRGGPATFRKGCLRPRVSRSSSSWMTGEPAGRVPMPVSACREARFSGTAIAIRRAGRSNRLRGRGSPEVLCRLRYRFRGQLDRNRQSRHGCLTRAPAGDLTPELRDAWPFGGRLHLAACLWQGRKTAMEELDIRSAYHGIPTNLSVSRHRIHKDFTCLPLS